MPEDLFPRCDSDDDSKPEDHAPTVSAPPASSKLSFCGIPIRLDGTLCDRDEVWLENPRTGEVIRVV